MDTGDAVSDAAKRGRVGFRIVHLVRYARPKVVLLENVWGLATSGLSKGKQTGEALHKLQTDLENAGYLTMVFRFNSMWLGTPQSRDRLFVIAFRKVLEMEEGGEEWGENTMDKFMQQVTDEGGV